MPVNTRILAKHLICLLLLFSTSVHAASIKKWIDQNGDVHYGNEPPPSTESQVVHVLDAPSNPGKSLPRLSTSDSADDIEDPVRNSSKVPPDQAKAACEQAQKDLKVIKRSDRIKLKGNDGSTRYLTTKEIQERRKAAENSIAQFCP